MANKNGQTIRLSIGSTRDLEPENQAAYEPKIPPKAYASPLENRAVHDPNNHSRANVWALPSTVYDHSSSNSQQG